MRDFNQMKYINFRNMIFSSHFLTIFLKDDVYKCKTIGGRGDRDVGFHYPLLDMLYKSESELGLSPSGSFLVVSSRMLQQRNELRFRMGWWWCLMLTMRRWCDDDVNRRNAWMYIISRTQNRASTEQMTFKNENEKTQSLCSVVIFYLRNDVIKFLGTSRSWCWRRNAQKLKLNYVLSSDSSVLFLVVFVVVRSRWSL